MSSREAKVKFGAKRRAAVPRPATAALRVTPPAPVAAAPVAAAPVARARLRRPPEVTGVPAFAKPARQSPPDKLLQRNIPTGRVQLAVAKR